MLKKILILFILLGSQQFMFADEADGKIELFWKKIKEKENVFFNSHLSTENDWEEARVLLRKINPGITFIVYDLIFDGKKDCIISAGCIKELFSTVNKIVGKAPQLKLLKPIALFPRMTKFVPLTIDDKPLAVADINFDHMKLENGKYDVMYILPSEHLSNVIDDDSDDYYNAYTRLLYLMTMQVLGERLMSDKIDAIDIYRDRVEKPGTPFVKLYDLVK